MEPMENCIDIQKSPIFVSTSYESLKEKAPLISKGFEDKVLMYGEHFVYGECREEVFIWFKLPNGASFFATFQDIAVI